MRTIRIYQPSDLAVGELLTLDRAASQHLIQVLRAKPGDHCIVFNGQGGEYHAELVAIHKKVAEVKLIDFIATDRQSPLNLHLGQALLRQEKMDWVIQKAVELGCHELTPVVFERCNVRLPTNRLEKKYQHWQAVAASAAEQSGSNRLLIIHPVTAISDFVSNCRAEFKCLFEPEATEPLPEASPPQSAAILIGPEGGIAEDELKLASEHKFDHYRLGPRVLRSETAAISALTLLQHRFGDLR